MVKDTSIRPFKELLLGSWEIFKGVWKNYLWLFLLESAVVIIYMILAFGSGVISTMLTTGSTTVDTATLASFGPAAIAGLLFLIPLSVAIQLAIYRNIYNNGEKTTEDFRTLLSYGFKNLLPFLLVAIMLGLILVGGYILLVIPGVILTLMFSMYYPVFILEGVRGFDVLKRSRELTAGHKWTIFKKYFIVFVAYLLVSVVVSFVGGFLGDFLGGVLNQALSFITAPIMIGYTYLVYTDLKAAK